MSPPAYHLVLDRIESAFMELASEPCGLTLGGTELGGWLRVPELRLHRMRDLLLDPPHPETVPSIWRELVTRFRKAGDRETWALVALGAMNPGIRAMCRRTGLPPCQQEDLQAELVAEVLDSLAVLRPEAPRLAGELYWAARRASSRFQRGLIDAERQLVPLDALPDRMTGPRGGHPDTALARLRARAVITEEEADLIGRTRLDGEPLVQAAARLGITYAACRKRRRRAEHRIVEHYASTGVLSDEQARQLLSGGLMAFTTPTSATSDRSTAIA